MDRDDKLSVMQFLIRESAKEEGALLSADTYPVWSPYSSPQAADVLLEALMSASLFGA